MIDLIQFPFNEGNTPEEKLASISNYLFQLSQQLEIILSSIGIDNLSDDLRATLSVLASQSSVANSNANGALEISNSVKKSTVTIDDVINSQKFKVTVTAYKDSAVEESKEYTEGYADVKDSASNALQVAKKYTDDEIARLIGQAPEALDTIYELAEAMASQQEVVDAVNKAIGKKADKATTLSGYGITDGATKDYVDDSTNDLVKDITINYETGELEYETKGE